MAYIGKTPIVGNFQKCDAITVVNGQAAYTLQVSSTNVIPESVNHMIVSLNGVIQSPTTAYSVSGATLTFVSNLATGDVIDFVILLGNVLDIGTPSDATVTNAKLGTDVISGETDIGGALADADLVLVDDGAGGTLRKSAMSRIKTYVGGGITEADMWRLTADADSPSGDITSNWERVDSYGQGNLGTGMSESSGIFTFPSTGFWLITAIGNMKFTGGAHDHAQFNIYTTTDNSSYNRAVRASDSSATTNYHASTSGSILFDVTSTSTHKVKFYSSGDWTLQGNTNENETHTWFLRVGDT